jgi:endogenous inhibitor of DNA gyrase (YacG/DUF329 family)
MRDAASFPSTTVPCPTCGGPSLFAPANAARPFCSQRCKDIDLGAWAAESFRVPAQPPQDNQYGDPRVED